MIAYALIGFAIVIAACIASGWAYEAISSSRDERKFPAPGRMLNIDGCRVHILEQGRDSPAVLFESGLAASSLSWSRVQPRVADFALTLSYDRAGLGWSSPCAGPLNLAGMARQLEQIFAQAAIPPPYILVGHSFGALPIRAFAHLHPDTVAGLVLVDPVSIQTWAHCSPANRARIGYGARLSRRGAFLARFGVVRIALASLARGQRAIPGTIGRVSSGRGNATLKRLVGEVGKLPAEVLPAVRSHWSSTKAFDSMAAHLECLPEAASTANEMPLPPDIPVIVLSAATATEAELTEREGWIQQSPLSRHIKVAGSGHWLHLERPEIVVAAIRTLKDRN